MDSPGTRHELPKYAVIIVDIILLAQSIEVDIQHAGAQSPAILSS
jgi:hypothetical protein